MLTYILLGLFVLHVCAVGFFGTRLLMTKAESLAMAFWLLAIMLLPGLGVAAYVLLDEARLTNRARRKGLSPNRNRPSEEQMKSWRAQWASGRDARQSRIAAHGEHTLNATPVPGNRLQILDDTTEIHRELLQLIGSAEQTLHMEYYIWLSDDTGREVLEAVTERAKQGVQCRLLLDSVGCFSVRSGFHDDAIAAGVEIVYFMSIRGTRRRAGLHLRNHRKIVVVDGKVGYCGSQNIASRSRGLDDDLGVRQIHMRLEGPAVADLQQLFLEDWNAFAEHPLDPEEHFPKLEETGSHWCQILGTGPHQDTHTLERLLLEIFALADKEVWMASPYFVPTQPVRMAMVQAASRGVRVNVLVSRDNDHPVTQWAAESYFEALLCEGVRIFSFQPGMVHSKILVADDILAIVGTANFDARSFRLNFEVSLLLFEPDLIDEVRDICEGYLAESVEISLEQVRAKSKYHQIRCGLARIIGPQL